MKYKITIFLAVTVIFLLSCTDFKESKMELGKKKYTEKLLYAKKFEINYFENITELKVSNPWQGAKDVEYTYYLSKTDNQPQTIKVPIQKAVVLSTTHIGLIDFIDETDKIMGVSGLNFVNNKKIVKNINAGKVKDVGYGANLNYELLLEMQPDVIFIYGVNAETQAQINKLTDLGIPTVIVAEYLEETPLAQAEWCKFMACFFEKNELAFKKFDDVAKQYNDLKRKIPENIYKPKILANLPYNGIWYASGGNSLMAQFIADASGQYLWFDNNSREALALSIENALLKAQDADIWINTGTAQSIDEILAVEERIENLKVLKNKQVFNNNKILNKKGGNDYFESGVCMPHIILKDLISIFHPQIIPNYEPFFYKQIH
jgi:iron complex transport system substrate-binding protein